MNFVEPEIQLAFFEEINSHQSDGLLISGDIAEAHTVTKFLEFMSEHVRCPIYFVLGNHDFYFSDVDSVRAAMTSLHTENRKLFYLTDQQPIPLNDSACLIGDDGWADGRAGNYDASTVYLHDYDLIRDIAQLESDERLIQLQRLATESSQRMDRILHQALQFYDLIYCLTHVPPYWESVWHDGKISDANWAPHFCNLTLGETFQRIMADFPAKQLIVLCGHTHGKGEATITPNIQVLTGDAVYGSPKINRIIKL